MSVFEAGWFRDLENKSKERAGRPAELPRSRRSAWRPDGYLPDPGLADAIRVALVLRKPLLLTGEPGTGKTECASFLAWKLGYGEALVFEGKSISEARDLFYTYDTLGRFHSKQDGQAPPDPRDFIHFNALGEAILRTLTESEARDVAPPEWSHQGSRQSVVLIDEIDKTPRDFPNDLLNEVDRLQFRVPEIGNRIKRAEDGYEPVVVITSNSEKHLPAAFLRRCVYYHIPFPENRLEEILISRLPEIDAGPLVDEAIDFFLYLRRAPSGLEKNPATAELLDWMVYLRSHGAKSTRGLRDQGAIVPRSLVALLKHQHDQSRAASLWEEWLRD